MLTAYIYELSHLQEFDDQNFDSILTRLKEIAVHYNICLIIGNILPLNLNSNGQADVLEITSIPQSLIDLPNKLISIHPVNDTPNVNGPPLKYVSVNVIKNDKGNLYGRVQLTYDKHINDFVETIN